MRQGLQPAVDPGAGAVVADLGVDGVGEVDRRRPLRQLDHLALGSEDEHLVGEQVQSQSVEELDVVLGVLQLQHPPHPRRLAVRLSAARRLSSLYTQWAATPFSAVRCMAWVRIWISSGLPCGPMTVVWSDW